MTVRPLEAPGRQARRLRAVNDTLARAALAGSAADRQRLLESAERKARILLDSITDLVINPAELT